MVRENARRYSQITQSNSSYDLNYRPLPPILKVQQRSRLLPILSKPQALPDLCIGCHAGFHDIPPGSQNVKTLHVGSPT